MSLRDRAHILSSFGQRLAHLRSLSGLTPSQFAAKSGIDAGNLSKYELGNREPGLIVIMIMAKCLNVRVKDLLEFDFSKANNQVPEVNASQQDPIALIRSLMLDRKMKAKDLVKVLGVSKGLVSDILNYKKGLSKQNIRRLADYFKIDIALLYSDI